MGDSGRPFFLRFLDKLEMTILCHLDQRGEVSSVMSSGVETFRDFSMRYA